MELHEGIALITVFALLVGAIDKCFVRTRDDAADWMDRDGMPLELRLATLVMSESAIRTQLPIPLHGIPDQVFRTWTGKLVPVDTKLRQFAKVHTSDIIQLSVYRVILRHSQQQPVAHYGYVRVVTKRSDGTTRARYVRRRLMSERAVIALYQKTLRVSP
jgi:hypothetical protein